MITFTGRNLDKKKNLHCFKSEGLAPGNGFVLDNASMPEYEHP